MMLYTILFAALGVILAALAMPLIQRRVRPNRIYGLRVPATLADEAVWYEANAVSGRHLLAFGLAIAASAIVVPLVTDVQTEVYAGVMVAILVLGLVVLAIVGWRHANRLLAERRAPR